MRTPAAATTRLASPLAIPLATVLAALCVGAAAPSAAAPAGPETAVATDARTALGITIYNDGQALVRDTRTLDLRAGLNRIAFRDVAAAIRPETASLKPVAGKGFVLLEQNFDFDLLTPATLLRKYAGREVSVLRTNPATGAETAERATVLATNDGVVLRYADRIETGAAGRIAFGDVPATLRDRPTLSIALDAPAAAKQDAELMYLTGNIGWKADYIANLDPDGKHMAIAGWVTLTNRSGTAYENAKLQLVAGTLNRVREQAMAAPAALDVATARMERAKMAEEKLADYHLYTLARPVTILDQQTKQVALLSAAAIPMRREYVIDSTHEGWWYQAAHAEIRKGIKPSVFLRFENRGGELGIPLPAGTVRVYTRDASGGAQLIGEDAIEHTAKGERIALRLGEAFDITADRRQTGYEVLAKRASKSSYRIEIRNADKTPVAVTVREPLRGDWTITEQNLRHVKESSGSAVWTVDVPAEGSATLEYTAVVRW